MERKQGNTNGKKVSVIIPTYNRAKFIPDALRSIRDQNYDNIEIIIIDDGSTDNTETVVASLMKEFSNIVFCHNERTKGPSGARNTGMLRASGDYITFLDSDDIWLDNHLKTGLKIFEQHPVVDVLFGDFKVVDYENNRFVYDFFSAKKVLFKLITEEIMPGVKLIKDNLFRALIQECFFILGSVIIKRENLSSVVLMNESIVFSEDRDFLIRLYKECNAKVAFREETVFVLRRHDGNLANKTDEAKEIAVFDERRCENEILLFLQYFDKYKLDSSEQVIIRKEISSRFINLAYFYRKAGSFYKSFCYILKSCKYKISLNKGIELIKLLSEFILSFVKRK